MELIIAIGLGLWIAVWTVISYLRIKKEYTEDDKK